MHDLRVAATGGGGNDIFVFDAGFGDDTVNGFTDGKDKVDFSTSVFADEAAVAAAGDTLISIENLFGETGNDSITGNSDHNLLDGAGGNDKLTGGNAAVLVATFSNDAIVTVNDFDLR